MGQEIETPLLLLAKPTLYKKPCQQVYCLALRIQLNMLKQGVRAPL